MKAATGTLPPVAALTLASNSIVAFCFPAASRYNVMRLQPAASAISCIERLVRAAYSKRGWCFLDITFCNTPCTEAQAPFVAPNVTHEFSAGSKLQRMQQRQLRKTYIHEWRKFRGLSLRALADRTELEPGGELLISHASLGRIERGLQPYSQPILEALATALDCEPQDLLSVNPMKAGEVVDLTRLLREATPEQRRLALDLVDRIIHPTGTND